MIHLHCNTMWLIAIWLILCFYSKFLIDGFIFMPYLVKCGTTIRFADLDNPVEKIKQLRKLSGASISLCRQTLESEDGIIERALDKIRLLSLETAGRLASRCVVDDTRLYITVVSLLVSL